MKKTKITILLLSALMMSFASCKTQSSKKVEYIEEPITVEAEQDSQKKNVPDQRQRVKGEWIIISANGNELSQTEERPYIDFSAREGRIYGFTGCNIVNGNFSVQPGNKIKFDNVITTMKFCDGISDERCVLNGLNEADNFTVYRQDDLYYLDIKNAAGETVLHMKRHNADVLTGTWGVSSIEGRHVSDKQIKLIIDVPESKIYGDTGCNIINGTLGVDRNKDWFIQFYSIVSTKKMCDEKSMKIERNLLVALEKVEFIHRISNKEMKLTDKDGNEVLHLHLINLKESR